MARYIGLILILFGVLVLIGGIVTFVIKLCVTVEKIRSYTITRDEETINVTVYPEWNYIEIEVLSLSPEMPGWPCGVLVIRGPEGNETWMSWGEERFNPCDEPCEYTLTFRFLEDVKTCTAHVNVIWEKLRKPRTTRICSHRCCCNVYWNHDPKQIQITRSITSQQSIG